MGALDEVLIPSLRLEEIASDGSTLANPAADSRHAFLGEDGSLHLKDSAGAVTDVGSGYAPGGTDVAVADGGTGASSASAARTNLGLGIGTDVQAQDADIPTVAGSQAEMEAGTEAALRSMSPLRVAQAIAALGGAGGGGGYSDLLLDYPAASPDADDDEFPGTSLAGAWTDPVTSAAGQTNTIVIANGWMVLEPATAGSSSTGKRVFGIRKPSPSGSFTVMAKIAVNDTGSDCRPGVYTAVTGGKAYVCGPEMQSNLAAMSIGVSTYSESADWGAYDGVHLTSHGPTIFGHLGWYRIRWDASVTTLYFDYSINGVVWRNFSSRSGATQPDRMGVCLYSNGATVQADEKLGVGWFRVIDGSAAF